MMKKYLLIGASAFILGAGSIAYVSQQATAAGPPRAKLYRMLGLFGDVVNTVEKQYVTEVDDTKLIQSAIQGMLTSLDPHSGYLNPENFDDMRDQTRGEYGGLGIEITTEDGVVKVITPMDGTPAVRAGIKAGDYITAVNGESILGLSIHEAVKQMRGPPGEPITLTIAREKSEPMDIEVVREVIKPESASARIRGDYGILRIASFNEKTTDAAETAFNKLKAENPQMKGLILDLRDNPGGLLDQAVGISDLFLEEGEIVSQRGRDLRDIERYNARPGDITGGLPMVVLINTGSASAAEIVAGALQDRKRAELVGLTSFGKGSVQTVIPLRGGIDGALKLTTARYYTPSGRSIQKTGIEPDLEVALTRDQAQRIADRTYQFSEASLSNALSADEGKVRRGAHQPAEAPPESFDEKEDFQITRAIDVLRHGSVADTPKLPKPDAKLASIIGAKPALAEAEPGASAAVE